MYLSQSIVASEGLSDGVLPSSERAALAVAIAQDYCQIDGQGGRVAVQSGQPESRLRSEVLELNLPQFCWQHANQVPS